MVALPRLVIAAPSTGQGKTTVATGLMAALRDAGHQVSGHKVGPDFIDPGYHALATGRPGRNLDPHLVGAERIVPLLRHGAAGADVAVIEGVMGLYDGRLGTDGFASTAHVATLTRSPVVLVIDVARLSRTAAAIAAGLAAFDPAVRVAGVILNRAGSARNDAEITRALDRAGLPVLGALPRDDRLAAPSRHLGLVPAAERGASAAMVARLGEQVARHLDLSAVADVARQAPDLGAGPWDPAGELRAAARDGDGAARADGPRTAARDVAGARPVVAMAGGRAFTFRYAETEELLRAAGCAVVTFDPLTDPALPPGTRGIYLGGGFPEMYAAELAANHALLRDLRSAVADGIPAVAECAGLLYLARSLDGVPMAGIVPAAAAMTGRLTLRYPEAIAAGDSLLTRAGERVTGHEFHRTQTAPPAGDHPAWEIDGAPTGFTGPTWHASYLHVHWAGHPHLAHRFAAAVHAAAPQEAVPPRAALATAVRASAPPRPPAAFGPPRVPGTTSADGQSAVIAGQDGEAAPSRAENAPLTGQCPPGSLSGAVIAGHTEAPRADAGAGGRAVADQEPASAGERSGPSRVRDPLRHHGDAEVRAGLLDFAVNVYAGERPAWLDRALHAAVDASAAYPDARPAHEAIGACHGRSLDEVLATSGAAEAFTLVARLRPWQRPVVVHPQFTEPHAALEQAGRTVAGVICRAEDGFALDPAAVPQDADLVVIGNPTNPTGVLHPAALIRQLLRPGRLVVVDEAFMDAVPGEAGSLAGESPDGLLVIRSLTKHWSIPGIRAGYVVGDPAVVADLARAQTPWSVSAPAIAATVACTTEEAAAEARERALTLGRWRGHLEAGLFARSVEHVPSAAPFVLARLGDGTRAALRSQGIAVRRADTFPGLDGTWARIAVRPPELTDRLLLALDRVGLPQGARLTGTA